jgi:hypothetical protein
MAYAYVPNFVEGGKVSLTIKHQDAKRDEVLEFGDLDDMEACAYARPYIPLEMWEVLTAMYQEAQAQHDPKHIF